MLYKCNLLSDIIIIIIIIRPMTGCGHRVAAQLSIWPTPSMCLGCMWMSESLRMISQSTLSVHFPLGLPLLLSLKVILCRMTVERLLAFRMYPYYFKFLFLTVVMRSSKRPVSCLMAPRITSFELRSGDLTRINKYGILFIIAVLYVNLSLSA